MAKFIELTGYFAGYSTTPEKKIINLDKVRWIAPGANPDETRLVFSDQYVFVLKSKMEEVLKLINRKLRFNREVNL